MNCLELDVRAKQGFRAFVPPAFENLRLGIKAQRLHVSCGHAIQNVSRSEPPWASFSVRLRAPKSTCMIHRLRRSVSCRASFCRALRQWDKLFRGKTIPGPHGHAEPPSVEHFVEIISQRPGRKNEKAFLRTTENGKKTPRARHSRPQNTIHSWKLTWKPKRGPVKTTVLLNWGYMGFHVSLGECNSLF